MVAVIYGVHLTVIATLNALLWLLALRGRSNPELLGTAIFPVFAFVLGTAIAFVAPSVAQFLWCLAFGAPFAGWLAARSHAVSAKVHQVLVLLLLRNDVRRASGSKYNPFDHLVGASNH